MWLNINRLQLSLHEELVSVSGSFTLDKPIGYSPECFILD